VGEDTPPPDAAHGKGHIENSSEPQGKTKAARFIPWPRCFSELAQVYVISVPRFNGFLLHVLLGKAMDKGGNVR